MPISTPMGKRVLDAIFGGIVFVPPATVHMRLWTVAPAPDGTGGTECTGTSVRPILSSAAAAVGSAGRVAQVASSQSVLFQGIAQASSAVVAASFHDDATGEIVWLTAWSPASTGDTWPAGGSPLIAAGNVVNAFTA